MSVDVSFLTAVAPKDVDWLSACSRSLKAMLEYEADEPSGLTWEWVTSLDKYGSAAGARNAGLTRARGTWIAVLDVDDEVEPFFLRSLVDVLNWFGYCDWFTWERWHVIGEPGTRADWWGEAEPAERCAAWSPGRYPPGAYTAFVLANRHSPFLPGGTVLKQEAVWEAGGWPALRWNEDLSLLCEIDKRRGAIGGYVSPGSAYRIRRRADQVSSTIDVETKDLSHQFLERRWNHG